jgi:hypothetical protein
VIALHRVSILRFPIDFHDDSEIFRAHGAGGGNKIWSGPVNDQE